MKYLWILVLLGACSGPQEQPPEQPEWKPPSEWQMKHVYRVDKNGNLIARNFVPSSTPFVGPPRSPESAADAADREQQNWQTDIWIGTGQWQRDINPPVRR